MQVEIYTLIDITNTGVRHADGDTTKFQQQSNYNTVIQTVSLTTNIIPKKTIIKHENINGLGFGSSFRNRHKFWSVVFETENSSVLDLKILKDNFHLVPIIIQLEETGKIIQPIFDTVDVTSCNIIFNLVDN